MGFICTHTDLSNFDKWWSDADFGLSYLITTVSPNFDFDHEPISKVLQITTVNTFLMAKYISLHTYAKLFFTCWKFLNPGHTIALQRASWVLGAIVRKKMFFLINAIQLDWSLAHFSFVFSFGTRPGRFDIAKMHHTKSLVEKRSDDWRFFPSAHCTEVGFSCFLSTFLYKHI
jgi:hypothetical protein